MTGKHFSALPDTTTVISLQFERIVLTADRRRAASRVTGPFDTERWDHSGFAAINCSVL